MKKVEKVCLVKLNHIKYLGDCACSDNNNFIRVRNDKPGKAQTKIVFR